MEIEIDINNLRDGVQRLLEFIPSTASDIITLQQFENSNDYTDQHFQALIKFLSTKLLDDHYTEAIAATFEQCLLLILTKSLRPDETVDEHNFVAYQRQCIALAKLMHMSPDAKRYATCYFRHKPAPFQNSAIHTGKPESKRIRRQTETLPDELAIVKCCYQLLCADVTYFKNLWNWSAFVSQYWSGQHTHGNDLLSIYCNHIMAMLTNMSASQLSKLNAQIAPEVLLNFDEEQCSSFDFVKTAADSDLVDMRTFHFNSEHVTNVEGVLLPIYNTDNYKFYAQTDGSYDKIVKVDSTCVNLRNIALGIAAGKAICLSGAVGSGKTTLIEYLARKTGRIYPKSQERTQQQKIEKENQFIHPKTNGNGSKRKSEVPTASANPLDIPPTNGFLRIQLGDQTDSKLLLGQYRCTDVPGEFIWLPGVLTQAVMHGYWLLLEDLDTATQDTYTILSALLEHKFLSVPGFRDCVKIEPGFQLFVTVRSNKSTTNSAQKSLYSLLEKYLYTINVLPLSRNELCKVVSTNYPKLSTVANRIVDVFLTFSRGEHNAADNLRQQETADKADTTENYVALPFEKVTLSAIPNSGRLVSTRDLIKLCQRSNPMFSVTSAECAYFVFQNAVDVFCSYLPQSKEKTKLITSIGAKLGIIPSRCIALAEEYKPEVQMDVERIKVGRAKLYTKAIMEEEISPHITEENMEPPQQKKPKMTVTAAAAFAAAKNSATTFSYTRIASCLLERVAVCVAHAEPVLLVGETGVGKTSAVQFLATRTQHKLVVVNMNNQSDVSDLVGGFKPVDLTYVIAPLRTDFEQLFRLTFNQTKNETFLNKFAICYNQGNYAVLVKLMLKVIHSVFEKSERNELRAKELELLPRWQHLQIKLQKLSVQLSKALNISFAFIPGALVNCIKRGDWVLLDEINLASAETLECLSTILEPDGSVVLLEKGDFTPVKRHADFRIFACMNPNTDIGKKDLPVGIRNRFTELYVDELTTDADLSLLVSDYLSNTGIQKKSVTNIVKLYKQLKQLSRLELNDGLGNRPVYSLRTLCRSLRICAKNLCGSIERNLYESCCMSFLTQLDPISHNVVLLLIRGALLSNPKAVLQQSMPEPPVGEHINFEGYWVQVGSQALQECSNYILTDSVRDHLKDVARIISIGKLPVLLQGPTSAGKTSLIEYIAKRSGNHCLRINNHEHTDLQEYIGTYTADVNGKLSFREGILAQAMRNGYWLILDELNLASTDILEALNRVLDDNRELFIPETQTLIKAHPHFMLFATQNPPGLYGGRKTLSRAFKNRFIELHFADIPRHELEIILEQRCFIPATYAKKMVMCMSDLQKHRQSSSSTKHVFTLRDLFRWGNRYTYADKQLLADQRYDWNQHLIEEGYLVLSAKVRTQSEIELIEETLYRNFRKRIDLARLFDAGGEQECSAVTSDIIAAIRGYKFRQDIVWTRNMTRMAVLAAKALQFDEPVLLVGPTGCGKTTVCQLLASIRGVRLRILNCHMHTEGADFLGGLRPCRGESHAEGETQKKQLFEWADGPLIHAMQEGSYFMADEISLAEDSVLERLNCVLEPERTVLLAEKGGVSGDGCDITEQLLVQAKEGFQFLATMNPGGDFGKKELSPALRNRFTEVWCLPSDAKEDLVRIASNCMLQQQHTWPNTTEIASFLVQVVLHMRDTVDKFKFSVRDILAWANYMATNAQLTFAEQAIFGLETVFLDALEMLPHESLDQIEQLKRSITEYAINQAGIILQEHFTLEDVATKRGQQVERHKAQFGIKPFYINMNTTATPSVEMEFLFEAPTTKQNLFRLLSALSLQKPVLLEGPPGVGKTSIVESIAHAIGYNIVRINLCEHTDLADLFGTDLPEEDNTAWNSTTETEARIGAFVWRDGPLLAALKTANTWILLDELNLAPQSVLEGLNAILDHRGEVYIPELNKSFQLDKQTRIFACQNPLRQGGGRKGLPQSFLNRFNKVYLRKLATEDLMYVVRHKYQTHFERWGAHFIDQLQTSTTSKPGNSSMSVFEAYKSCQSTVANLHFDLCERLVRFSQHLDAGISNMEFGYKGGPYEINLRDILRWCDLLVSPQTGYILPSKKNPIDNAFRVHFESFLLVLYERMKLVYYQRMRDEQDKRYIRNAFAGAFCCDALQLNDLSEDVALYWTNDKVYLNDIILPRQPPNRRNKPQNKEIAPFLLSSQREMLKHVVECVHMEKPVLLCGAVDTGKTKIINALCTLSHQTCNTDTIDDSVTGSFQQIDLNRHLEEISLNVESLLLSCMQDVVLQRDVSAECAAKLLHVWGDYTILYKSTTEFNNANAMSEELQLFRKRIKHLDGVIDELLQRASHSIATQNELKALQDRLNLLRMYTNRTDSLNTGGSFEWVDSTIVKSLKCGQYILLEHINLCSSAVLDRLNPVFEPGGRLLISEKGVSAHNSAEIVEKAPNFRAFLTIDPKYGELSRAMRNRCVELALHKDNAYSVDDMRAIVHAQGVRSAIAIDCLLEIHRRVGELTELHLYNVTQLTQCAFLTASYKHIGYGLQRALYVSAMEVYVYACNTDYLGYGLAYYQNKLRDIVLEESNKLTPDATSTASALSLVMLRSDELDEVTRIKLQAAPLQVLLNNGSLIQLCQEFESLQLKNAKENFTKFLLYVLYECSSMSDVELRHCYLTRLCAAEQPLCALSSEFHARITAYRAYFSQAELPWNAQLYPRIRDYNAGTCELPHIFRLSATLLVQLLLDAVPNEGVTKLKHINALAYSQAINGQGITDKLNNEFLKHYANFMTQLQIVLRSDLRPAQFDLEHYTKFITELLWSNRLLSMSRSQLHVNNKQLHTDLMDKLLLHFKWLEKQLLHLLMQLIPDFSQSYPEFERSWQKLQKYALSMKPPLNLLRKIYAKQMIQFQAYYQEAQVKFNVLVDNLQQILAIVPTYGSNASQQVLRKLVAQESDEARRALNVVQSVAENRLDYKFKELKLSENANDLLPEELRNAVLHFNAELREYENTIGRTLTEDDLTTLSANVQLLEAIVKAPEEEELSINVSEKDIEWRLLPLREFYLNKALLHAFRSFANAGVNERYCEATASITCHNWQLIKLLESRNYQNFARLWSLIKEQQPQQFKAIFESLSNGYKNLRSYARLICQALQQQQLNSLANRPNYNNNEPLCARYEYAGPALLNALSGLIFQTDGQLKSIPLAEFEHWQDALKQIQQLMWHNASLMLPTYYSAQHELAEARQNAQRLLHELDYVVERSKQSAAVAAEDVQNDYNTHFQQLVEALRTQLNTKAHEEEKTEQREIHAALQQQAEEFQAAMLCALTGAVELSLLSYMPLIDPVEKQRLKRLYNAEDIDSLSALLNAYDCMRIVLQYKRLGADVYNALEVRLREAHAQQQQFTQQVALRPAECRYGALVQDITHFLRTNCAPQALLQLLQTVQRVWKEKNTVEATTETRAKIELWLANAQRFLGHTCKPYAAHYQDLLQPLQCAVEQLRNGFEHLKTLLTQRLGGDDRLHGVLANLVAFPATQMLHIYDVRTGRDVRQQRAAIYTLLEPLSGSEHDYLRLLQAKLSELCNRMTLATRIESDCFRDYDYALHVCNQLWQQQEQCRREQQAADESLYVHKANVHCAEEDEELLELQEIDELFPTNMQQDFGDLVQEHTLEQVMKLDKKKKVKQPDNDEHNNFLVEHFLHNMEQYTVDVSHHKPTQQQAPPEFLKPFKQRLQVFNKLYQHYRPALNDWLVANAYSSYAYANGLQQQSLDGASDASPVAYNYYKHANVSEVRGVQTLLQRIETCVDAQLALYPEHAGLADIKCVIDRIRALPYTAPLVRYNTGFQLLRQRLSAWNELAHRLNHLRDEEHQVAEYVQRWMKLELQCWRNSLTQVSAKVAAQAHRYWYFIYQLLQEYLQSDALDSTFMDVRSTEQRFGEGALLDKGERTPVVLADVVRILRQFVEAATYGDFAVRLQLLQAFELYLHNLYEHMASDADVERLQTLTAAMRNLQIYFTQFAEEVTETQRQMRTPIEKKLREFVKIESYNKDLSYFSMRSNVARVHRQLHKFLKEYEKQLQQRITPLFQPRDARAQDFNFANDKGKDLRYATRIKYCLTDVKAFVAPPQLCDKYVAHEEEENINTSSLLARVRKLYATARNVVQKTVSQAAYPQHIIALDELLTSQLERCEQLRSLTVDRTQERRKQKVEAKHILQQKRKGLSDLFKLLTQLGLSFKSGLLELSLREEFMEYTLPPFCVRTMLCGGGGGRDNMLWRQSDQLDGYYAKSAFKLQQLQQLMLAPLAELGGAVQTDRMKGYAVDLFLLVQQQRRLLADSVRDSHTLRNQLQQLRELTIVMDKANITDQFEFSDSRQIYCTLRQSLCQVRYVFEQFMLLLSCAPSHQQAEHVVLRDVEEVGPESFEMASKLSTQLLDLVKRTHADMLQHDQEFLQPTLLAAYQKAYADIVKLIVRVKDTLSVAGQCLPIAQCLVELLALIEQTNVEISQPPAAIELLADEEARIECELEQILHGALLSLQKLYKKYTKPVETVNSSHENDDIATELQTQHLKEHLHGALLTDWQTLQMRVISEKLQNVLLSLKHAIVRPTACVRKVIAMLPILEQYNLLGDYYLYQQLGAHRVSVKMLSVMLTVFVELAMKGFCVPADLMQDEEGEQKKQDQKQGEGFGLEDGTGEQDASDKIESEDQLENAKRPEDQKEDGDKQQPDCKEEKGIEMSDDFEGKMQDIEKPEKEEDDSGESEEEEDDLNKEMGETEEGAEKLDDQIWGDDEEKPEEQEENEQELNEEQGKGNKDEKDAHNDLDAQNDAADKNGETEQDNDGLDATDDRKEQRKEQAKDIDNMQEPEVDEDQNNPYHNELEEPPEAEDMDLGDMNNGEDREEGDNDQQGDENPFDIDTMKEQMELPDDAENGIDAEGEAEEENKDNENIDSSDSDDDQNNDEGNENIREDEKVADEEEKGDEQDEAETQKRTEFDEAPANDEADKPEEEESEKRSEKPENYEQSKDKSSKEENVQTVEEKENKGSADQVQNADQTEKDVKQEQKLDEQETGEEKDGVGQAENEEKSEGHQGVAETKDTLTKEERKQQQQRQEKHKQGGTNDERTLDESRKDDVKQLKTIDKLQQQKDEPEQNGEKPNEEDDIESEEYQHVREPKTQDKTTLDNATEEQSKRMQHQEDEPQKDDAEDEQKNDDQMDIDQVPEEHDDQGEQNDENLEEMTAEKIENEKSQKPSKSDKTKERADAQQDVEVEGELVLTMNVPRSNDTTAHCLKEALAESATQGEELSAAETLEMRKHYQQQLLNNKMTLPEHEDYEIWQKISSRMAQNARELCEQLRLILEPTKCTRLKGDYRTGRRINMRKIIPYIASQFRKDKIWLRRTKAAQRDYKITIAIDDSKSMDHNNSKTLTLEAISLVSQALTLLESGRLSIVSFGELPRLILNHTEQFDGPKLVQALNFEQNKTKIGDLLDFVRTINTEEGVGGSDNGLFENLLLVLSDGRNIYSEGKAKVKNAIKLARLQRIFLVYIIIDNPENKNSILDIQTMEMRPDKSISIKSYLDDFPFPYYVIVRDLNQLPLVLSEAMRQWFELVNSEQ